MSTVAKAAHIAAIAHRGQVDKAGNPYIGHPAAVAGLLELHGNLAVMAGWLHDVVEDSSYNLGDLRDAGFPDEVLTAVDAVTKRPGETYEQAVRRAATDPLGRLVKLADNAHNSDEVRLALLPPEKADRLRRKYAQAREILTASSTLADLIRARLIELSDDGVDGTEEEQAIGAATEISALSAAVDAVLELHAPDDDLWPSAGTVCRHCTGEAEAEYPCPTVCAVAAALGIDTAPGGADDAATAGTDVFWRYGIAEPTAPGGVLPVIGGVPRSPKTVRRAYVPVGEWEPVPAADGAGVRRG